MMVAVNRFDSIEDKARCQNEIRQQLEELLPRTLAEEKELVHFISAREYLRYGKEGAPAASKTSAMVDAFRTMETCLRTFLLEKRIQSKLAPAANYLLNVLADMVLLSEHDHSLAQKELQEVENDLAMASPALSQLQSLETTFSDECHQKSDETMQRVGYVCKHEFERFLSELPSVVGRIRYDGLLFSRSYSAEILRTSRRHLQQTILECQAHAVRHVRETIENLHGKVEAVLPTVISVDSLMEDAERRIRTTPEFIIQQEWLPIQAEFADYFEIPANALPITLAVSSMGILGSGMFGFRRIGMSLVHVGQMVGLTSVTSMVLGSVAAVGMCCESAWWLLVFHVSPSMVAIIRHWFHRVLILGCPTHALEEAGAQDQAPREEGTASTPGGGSFVWGCAEVAGGHVLPTEAECQRSPDQRVQTPSPLDGTSSGSCGRVPLLWRARSAGRRLAVHPTGNAPYRSA